MTQPILQQPKQLLQVQPQLNSGRPLGQGSGQLIAHSCLRLGGSRSKPDQTSTHPAPSNPARAMPCLPLPVCPSSRICTCSCTWPAPSLHLHGSSLPPLSRQAAFIANLPAHCPLFDPPRQRGSLKGPYVLRARGCPLPTHTHTYAVNHLPTSVPVPVPTTAWLLSSYCSSSKDIRDTRQAIKKLCRRSEYQTTETHYGHTRRRSSPITRGETPAANATTTAICDRSAPTATTRDTLPSQVS